MRSFAIRVTRPCSLFVVGTLLSCVTAPNQRPPLRQSLRPAGWDKRRADTGSRYAVWAGKRAASTIRHQRYQPLAITARVLTKHQEKGALYARVQLSTKLSSLNGFSVSVVSPAHAVALPIGEQGDQLLLRFVNAPPAASKLSLVVYGLRLAARGTKGGAEGDKDAQYEEIPLHGEARLEGLGQAKGEGALAAAFFRAAAEKWRRGRLDPRGRTAFSAFASGRLSVWARELVNERLTSPGSRSMPMPQRRRRSRLGEMMALYTGLTSVEEALQTDRALFFRRDYKKGATVALASIKGVELPAHPWDSMIAELGEKKSLVIDPLAQHVPAEMAYLFAHDLRTLVRVQGELGGRFSELVQALEGRGGDHSFIKRYERQLAIRRSALAEKLGHIASKGVALITTDPLQREGSDMTLLFGLGNEMLLRAVLRKYAVEAKARRSDATTRTFKLAGHEVELLSTPDHDVHRYLMRLGSILVLSNSKFVLERLIAVKQKQATSLAESGDYRYMRARYPFSKDKEDAFAFMGDAFVAHVTGPRFKILQARRMEAKADLQAVGFAALLHGWLQGKAPKNTAELRARGYLAPQELHHADGAKISYTPQRGAHSSWGRAYQLTPLADLSLQDVTTTEEQAYQRFRDSYQRNWRGYIDPVALRIRAPRSGQLAFDGRMLPLNERSDYDHLLKMVGQTVARAPDLKSGLLFSFAVGKGATLRKVVDSAAMGALGSKKVRIGWLGDWVAVGASDRGGLYDLGATVADAPMPGSKGRGRMANLALVLARAPLFAEAHVVGHLALVGVLSALRAKLSETAPGMVTWKKGLPYREQAITEVHVRTGRELGGTLHYAVVKDVLTLSLDRGTMEERIDAHLDGAAHAKLVKPMQSTVRVRPWPKKSWLSRVLMLAAGRFAWKAEVRALEALTLLEACKQPWDNGSEPGRLRALGHLGWVPASVHGGKLTVNGDGIPHDSVWGDPYLRLPWSEQKAAMKNSPLRRVLGALQDLQLSLAFEGKGAHRGLHVRSRWFYRPSSK